MILFWTVISFMVLIALGFIIWPFRQQSARKVVPESTEQTVYLALYQQRQQELTAEFNSGAINEKEFQQRHLELQKELLADAPQVEQASLKSSVAWILWLIIILFPIAAIALYWYWGSHQALQKYLAVQQQEAKVRAELGTPAEVIAKLQQRLQQDPSSVQGWYLLGRLQLSQNHLPEAVNAFAKANALQANNPDLMMQYAQALYFAQQQQLTGQALALTQQVQKLQPENEQLLNLLGITAFHQGEFRQAILLWQRLLSHYPPNSQDFKAIQRAINQAQAKLPKGEQAVQVSVKVTVKIAQAAAAKAKPEQVVFIYARAATGSKMPLAISRKQVHDLPLTVELTQAMAMNSSASLANAAQITIVARISQTGQAIAQVGDWEGQSSVIDLTTSSQPKTTVVIDKLLDKN